MVKIDFGCGLAKHPDAIGLDMNRSVNPDILFEVISRERLPFADNYFEGGYAIDFLEHIQDIPWFLSEAHRVIQNGGILGVRYPHRTNKSSYNDVTHVHYLGIQALDHFDPSTEYGKKYPYYKQFGRNFPFHIEDSQLVLSGGHLGKLSRVLHRIVGNEIYEDHFAIFLPIRDVSINLRVLKE